MSREWKPGDVAMVSALNKSEPYRAYFDGKTWREYDADMFCVDAPHTYRPLVVIDPEDPEQVEALWQAWRDLAPDHRLAQDNMQAALRSLVTPPKPDRPLGWGAVVEDDTGAYWTQYAPEADVWINYAEGRRQYTEIAAVRVLSEGVTA